jgi:hypothetical protein
MCFALSMNLIRCTYFFIMLTIRISPFSSHSISSTTYIEFYNELESSNGSEYSCLLPILQNETFPALSPIATIAVTYPFQRYSFGLNLQQLIDAQCPMKMFFVLKSLVLERFIATLILLSSKEGQTKLLKSGDHDGVRTSLIGFILNPSGESLTDLYFS